MTARCASTFTTRPCHLASEMSLEVAAGGLERRPSFTLVATWRPRIERSRRTDDEGAREGINTPVNAGSAHVARPRGERRYKGYWVNSLCFKRTRRIYLVMLVRGRHTDATNSAEPRRRPATRSETVRGACPDAVVSDVTCVISPPSRAHPLVHSLDTAATRARRSRTGPQTTRGEMV